jgi:hypothetical protein
MLKSRINLRRVFIFTAAVALTIIYAVLWMRMISSPAERTGTDFIAFYTAGRIAQQAGAEHVYEQDLQQQIEAKEVGFTLVPGQVLLYNHMPTLIPILQLVSGENYIASFAGWCLILIGLFLLANVLLGRLLRQRGYDSQSVLFAIAGSFLFFPSFYSVLNGQDTAFLLLGAVCWLTGVIYKNDLFAGLGLSLMTVRPHIALALAIPFLFQRRKVLVYFLAGAGLLAAFSLLLLGEKGVQDFIKILSISAEGKWYGMNEAGMFNLVGLLSRILPTQSDLIRVLGWIVYFGGLLALCLLWRNYPLDEKGLGLAILLVLFTAPHLHFHDLALLLIPIFCILLLNHLPGLRQKIVLLPLILSSVLFSSVPVSFLEYSLPYLVMLFLVIYLLFPQKVNQLVF